MRVTLLVLPALYIASAALAQSPFAVSIVPSRSYTTERRITTAASGPEAFYVVITNISERPHAVWALSNSWGFRSLSFELSVSGQPVSTLFKKPQPFTMNVPRSFLIPPHEHAVLPIQLDAQWENRPVFRVAGTDSVTMRVIYEVGPSPEATEQSVWVGRVVSPTYAFTLNHW